MELNDFLKKYSIQSDLCENYWRDFFLGSYFHRERNQEHGWFSAHFVGKLFSYFFSCVLLGCFCRGTYLEKNLCH